MILEICEKIHMHNMGTSDALSDSEYNKLKKYLRTRIKQWTPSHSMSQTYDSAVRHLIEVTIAEQNCYETNNNNTKYFVITNSPDSIKEIRAVYSEIDDAMDWVVNNPYFELRKAKWDDGSFPDISEMELV